ncbi:hypothetical protein BGZ76_010658, partial [Entomortierella beljakovae]
MLLRNSTSTSSTSLAAHEAEANTNADSSSSGTSNSGKRKVTTGNGSSTNTTQKRPRKNGKGKEVDRDNGPRSQSKRRKPTKPKGQTVKKLKRAKLGYRARSDLLAEGETTSDTCLFELEDADAALARKISACRVLEDILSPPFTRTIYCERNFVDDYRVSSIRALAFLQTVVFTRKVKKHVDAETGYSGQLFKQPPKWDPAEESKADILNGRIDRLDLSDIYNHAPPQTEDSDDDDEQHVILEAQDVDSDDPDNYEYEADEDESLGVNKEVASQLTEPVQTCAPITLSGSQPVESAPPHATASTESTAGCPQGPQTVSATTAAAIRSQEDKYGRKIIEVPVGAETVECALKAICFLWKRQAAGDTSARNLAPNPRKDIALVDAVKKYKLDLIYDKPVTGKIRTGTCSARDPYTGGL